MLLYGAFLRDKFSVENDPTTIELIGILNLSVNLNTASERDITRAILRVNKQIKVTFDSMTCKVTDIIPL